MWCNKEIGNRIKVVFRSIAYEFALLECLMFSKGLLAKKQVDFTHFTFFLKYSCN